jgi:Uma2 family endonuclease
MAFPAHQSACYEDLLLLPEHLVGEIINGVLITHPRPAPKHTLAYSVLGGELQGPFGQGRGGPGGWWILDEPELHISGEILVPDMAGWRRERMPKLPDTAWFEMVPDWLCEILSPSTARMDRAEKLPRYAHWGVAYIWLIDPNLRILEAYQNQNGHWIWVTTLKDNDPVSLLPFEAIRFSLGGLWVD